MFCYCGNGPVNRVDTNGYSWKEFWDKVGDVVITVGNCIVDCTAELGPTVTSIYGKVVSIIDITSANTNMQLQLQLYHKIELYMLRM